MKLHKTSFLLTALLLLGTSCIIQPMDPPTEELKPIPKKTSKRKKVLKWATGWIEVAEKMILGEASVANAEEKLHVPGDPFPFGELPKEIQREIVFLFSLYGSAESLNEAAQTINSLAQVNKHLNTLINDPNFCLLIIKNLAQRFDCSDLKVCERLQTKEAKKRLALQKKLYTLCMRATPENVYGPLLVQLHLQGVDLDFTYLDENITPLLLAIVTSNVSLVKDLLSLGADPERTNYKTGKTPLMMVNNYERMWHSALGPLYENAVSMKKLIEQAIEKKRTKK